MNAFVVRCYRVPAHAGKLVRAAIRHHLYVGHAAAHVIYRGSLIVCVAVPLSIAAKHFAPSLVAPSLALRPMSAELFSPAPLSIPEPSDLAVFMIGILILLWLRRRSPARGAAATRGDT
jgi:hypothetical protein